MFSEHVYCCVLSLLSHLSRHYFQLVCRRAAAIFHNFCRSPLRIRFYHALKVSDVYVYILAQIQAALLKYISI